MASRLGADLYIMDLKDNGARRYLLCSIRTLLVLFKKRPKIVFAQNPSVVLTLLLILLRPFFKYILVSDAHFGGVVAYNKNPLLQRVLDHCNRRADLVIVTNDNHADYVKKVGGQSVACEDPLPDLSRYCKESSEDKLIFFVCSFDVDEPYETVFEAAEDLIHEGFKLCVSGDYSKVNLDPQEFPHVTFLGYRTEKEFYRFLFDSEIILDLTSNDDCLVCGGYEAMSAERPLVTSPSQALRQYFTHGTVFTQHSRAAIVSSIRFAYENKETLRKDIARWKKKALEDNDRKIEMIRTLLSDLRTGRAGLDM